MKYDDDEIANFKKNYLGAKNLSKFSTWLECVLKKNGWTLRKKTVSQKIPNNWVEVARADSARICELMKAGVEVLINSDEMFVQFYPADDRVVAPKRSSPCGQQY
jgi:hypothetical protein